MQLALELPREQGAEAGNRCLDKAERTGFDAEGARMFVLDYLKAHGASNGESITLAAKAAGFKPHDDRAFGPVYAVLARRSLIRCAGFCMRQRGHGTAGGRVWELGR
jgi:hypothetical protein